MQQITKYTSYIYNVHVGGIGIVCATPNEYITLKRQIN